MKLIDSFQHRLKVAMDNKGIKQVDLVNKTGIDKTLINKYLTGVSNAKQDKLTLLAESLNVNEIWLMGYDVPMDRNLEILMSDLENNEIILNKFSERLFKLIKENNTDVNVLASRLGIKSKSTIYRYMNGEMAPKVTTVKYLAEIFNVNPVWLMGYDVPMNNTTNSNKIDDIFFIPILGRVPAGEPILAKENIEGYLPISPTLVHQSNINGLFFLRVQGNSMNKEYKDGSYVLVKQQNTAENGDNIVAIVNGDDEVTLKKFRQIDKQFVMLEANSTENYDNRVINLKDTNFRILGKVIGNFNIEK